MILQVLRKFYLLWLNFVSTLRFYRFKVSVWLNLGRVIMGNNIKFSHTVIFQGRGHLSVKDNVTFGFKLAGAVNDPIILQPRNREAILEIGSNTSIMNGCELIACKKVTIGTKCLIGPRTIFMDSDFHGLAPSDRNTPGKSAPISIGDNVWIGSRCLILKGVHIENDAVVAACSTVTKNVKAGRIVAGSPAKVIGSVYQAGKNV